MDVAAAASYFALSATLAQLVALHGTPEQKDRWLEPVRCDRVFLYSGALSEPDRAGSDLFSPVADPALGVQTVARLEGDEYVLNGRKSGFVTNAGVADAYFVMARTAWDAPPAESMSMLVVPAALKLAKTALDVHSARLVIREAACAADADTGVGAARAPGAKVAAVDAAIRSAQRAVEILGGYGVSEEFHAARYLNDAWVGWSYDFTRDVLLLGIAASL